MPRTKTRITGDDGLPSAIGGAVRPLTRGAADATRPAPSLLKLIAQATTLVDLLPHLHRHAIAAARGSGSLLFESNTRSGALQATSGYRIEDMPTDPWLPSAAEA